MLTLFRLNRNSSCYWIVAAIGVLLFGVSNGWAADPVIEAEKVTGFLDKIGDQFEKTAQGWEFALRKAAVYVFRVLLVIDIVYISFDSLFIKGEDLRTWAGEILRQVLIIGFFSFVLFNSGDIAQVVFKGFEQLAGIAGGAAGIDASSPSKILDTGLKNAHKMVLTMMGKDGLAQLAKAIFAIVFTGGIYTSIISTINGCIILIYCMIACRVLITQIEVYLSLTCGLVVLAFGGSRWTREPAIRYCWFLMALALKLFTIYMLISVGDKMMNDLFFNTPPGSLKESMSMWFMVVGILAIWLVILWVIPNSVAQLVSHIGGVGGGGAAGASAASGLIGGSLAFAGSAVSGAVKAAGVAAAPATAGAGLAVSAAVAAGEKAIQMGIGAASAVASQAGGSGQGGGSKNTLGGIASRVGPGSTNSAISSGRAQASSKSGSSGSGGSAAAGSMAASAATTALGGIAKGVTGTLSGAASLGATGSLSGQRTSSSPETSFGQQREAIKRSSNLPKK